MATGKSNTKYYKVAISFFSYSHIGLKRFSPFHSQVCIIFYGSLLSIGPAWKLQCGTMHVTV